MKFTVDKDAFGSGLQQVLSVTGTRTTRPILNNVLIEASGDSVTLTATNLDMGIRCSLFAQVEKPGRTTLPAKKLASIVKELPKQQVEVTASDSDQVKVSSGGSQFRMMGIGAADFPSLPTTSTLLEVTLDQELLQRMLKSVSYAQSQDESRYILNGVHFKLQDRTLTLVATDGRRLSMISSEVDTLGSSQIIVPAKAVSELERLLSKGSKTRIAFSEGHVAFAIELSEEVRSKGLLNELYLISKIVDGDYPDYMKVVPKETVHQVSIDRELMCECVRRCALIVSPKNNSVKLNISSNVMEFSASSSEYGECHESMAIQYEGPSVQLAFNPNFILEPLERLQQDEIIFGFGSELSPGLFKNMERFICVIMPLKT